MTPEQIILAAIPNADARLVEAILWERTPFPMGEVTAKSIYKAASRFNRATIKGIRLCGLCDNISNNEKFMCDSCKSSLDKHKE